MAVLNPLKTTVNDLCVQALKDAGALGIGQTALAEDLTDAWARLQWMLQQWERQRWMIFHLVTYIVPCVANKTTPYSVGPGGQIDTAAPSDFNSDFVQADSLTARPNQIESAFFQQDLSGGGLSPIVYPLRLYRAMEDYRRIALPSLTTFPRAAFYDPAWPLGQLYIWPWPNSLQYSIGIVCREQLPQSFANANNVLALPFEYFQAIVSNLAISLRPKYGIGTFPGDLLPAAAKHGRDVVSSGSTQIASIQMPAELVRSGNYNIYSDQSY